MFAGNVWKKGDIIIDGGNTFFRYNPSPILEELSAEGFNFIGTRVSGGEALKGPIYHARRSERCLGQIWRRS